jgi:hypothetical protein
MRECPVTSGEEEVVQAEMDTKGRVVTSMEEVERVDEAWARAIGRFIVAFANLEQWTRLYIRTFGTEEEAAAAKTQRLKNRIAVAHAVLIRLRLTAQMQHRVDTAIAGFRKLTPTRNLLAHNPPAIHIYTENEDGTGSMEIRHELRDSRDPSVAVTIKQLEVECAEAKQLDEEFALLYGLVRKPDNRRREGAG